MLYQLGALTFAVWPFNTHQVGRDTGADFAAKDLVGSPRSREFVGEGDEQITLEGRLFPEKMGGLSSLDLLHAMRAGGEAQILVRGDGRNFGWYVIEKVSERGSHLDAKGVGRMIEFTVTLTRAGPPAGGRYLFDLFRLFAMGG